MLSIALICPDNESISMGLRNISAILQMHGYNPRLIFLETNDKILDLGLLQQLSLLIQDCDVIGLSCFAQGSKKAKQILEYVRPLGKVSIWGGIHASLNPDKCADFADYLCIGEGEGMIVEFMGKLEKHEDLREIQNIAYKDNGRLIINELRPVISNLDNLPLPDFSFNNEYHLTKDGLKQLFHLPNVDRNAQITFISSRGCDFHCSYCCNIKLKKLYSSEKHYVRRMSISKLIEHSKKLHDIFPKGKYFYFLDEDFAARPVNELEELSERFPIEVGLKFECLAHPVRINEKTMNLLVRAGLIRIRIGIETGSERTKKEIYLREVSNKIVMRATQTISKYPQVAPVYFFIFANPLENREDLLSTINLIKELPYGSNIQAFELIFFPGSYLYEEVLRKGIIKEDEYNGFELNYYGGFHFEEYKWKETNLYLNGLIFLLAGTCTRIHIGIIPRFLLNFLIRKDVVDFLERYTFFIKFIIRTKQKLWFFRHKIVQLLKIFINDPTAIYNTWYYIREKFSPGRSRKKFNEQT